MVGELLLVDQLLHLLPDGAVGAQFPHGLLDLDQVVLLRAEDRAGPGDSDPADELSGWKVVVFHGVAGDQGACSSQACLAVDGQRAVGLLRNLQEFIDDLHGGNAAVRKVQLMMPDSILDEVVGLVGLVVEPHHSLRAQFLEDWRVVLRRERPILPNSDDTPCLSMVLSEGLLKAINFCGMIQFKSPFSIRS